MQNDVNKRAKQIVAGSAAKPDEIKEIVKKLKENFNFGLCRKLLTKISNESKKKDPFHTWSLQQLSLCTYKDEELVPAKRFAQALKILESIGLRNIETKDPETLSLGGAVFKRMWEYNGQLEHLYDALFMYRAAYERAPDEDQGYGGINAAFILQILASRARAAQNRSGTRAKECEKFETDADDLRKKIAAQLESLFQNDESLTKNNWLVVTLAEALYGLKNYEQAGKWLARSKNLEISEWKQQTTFRQLVSIARYQGIELPEEGSNQATWHGAWQALSNLLETDTEAALSCYRGKVGLALSGGGFRASFYHLGVLARLAEMDVLRSVETLSTVSGGSIVGAQYYLAVKHHLETKEDNDITREDYIEIVRNVQENFFNGVKNNIRTLALADFKKNLKMIFTKKYSRSHRLGELFDQNFYSEFKPGVTKDNPITMADLLIQPCEKEKKSFHPRFSNWKRRAKVPTMLLNATCLNTGHSWHFTARSMGEPPGLLGNEVDKNSRYRRLWYGQAPDEELRDYPLGYAVAASACVPGLFAPLMLKDLYPDRVVRLVDGGVHDNQGVQGLLDENCSFILCSDASGQMQDINKPSDGLPSVLLRTNSIMMDRIREAQYQDLRARLDNRALQGLFFIHLQKDLHVCPQDWIKCQDPTPESKDTDTPLPYGIDPKLQRLIAGIRTDLDSFSEVEAYALMYSGYVMTEQQFKTLQEQHLKDGQKGTWGGFQVNAPRGNWEFLDKQFESLLQTSKNSGKAGKDLQKQIETGSSKFFKIWKLNQPLKISALAAALVIAAGLFFYLKSHWGDDFIYVSLSVGSFTIVFSLLLGSIFFPMIKWLRPEKAARSIILKILGALVGFIFAKLHISIFNKMFQDRGKLSRLLNLTQK
ncbi:patatin-like phospholipase family protein [Desulfobacter curvatus]|uniref:patatin-like phospholipase family protein n=1 Tax=Desulfobacter curvatus TaxID=2290 RepID=UPI00039F81BE|nr:patatin-like phospholipase family protein [Desulfobacter curvatus]